MHIHKSMKTKSHSSIDMIHFASWIKWNRLNEKEKNQMH